ncbi:MAG: hypothetical protein HQL74_16155 [Magnetococcales bacterium]|nr:hypothetical protein [Magnetococcales bacterium]
MDNYDLSSHEDGFCLSINGKKVLSGVAKLSDLMEAVAELMDQEVINTLSREHYPTQCDPKICPERSKVH